MKFYIRTDQNADKKTTSCKTFFLCVFNFENNEGNRNKISYKLIDFHYDKGNGLFMSIDFSFTIINKMMMIWKVHFWITGLIWDLL